MALTKLGNKNAFYQYFMILFELKTVLILNQLRKLIILN